MSEGKKGRPVFVMVVVLILWGVDFIGIEYMVQYMSPGIYTLLRLLIGSAVLLAASFFKHGGLHIEKKDWPRVFICGTVAMSLYFTLEGYGIQMTSASFGALILATVPIFGMIGDRIFFGRKMTPLKIGCIVISIAGVYLLVAGDLSNSKFAGMIVILIAAVLWAFQIIYVKPLYDRYDLLTILTGLFLSATVFQVPVALATDPYFSITPAGVVVTLATTIVCLVLGQTGYVYGIGNLSVTTVSAFENLVPVVTIILSFVLYGVTLSAMQFAGAVLIIGAVMCIAGKD